MVIDRKTAFVGLKDSKINYEDKNLHDEFSFVDTSVRKSKNRHKAFTLWFTGLSGSGKSTLCRYLELKLFNSDKNVVWLDGDKIRKGLCNDLGFSNADREENIRRVAEVAKLLNDSGTIVLCSFISPTKESRDNAKKIIGKDSFHLVFVETDIEVCEKRDPNGLYAKARKGEIKNFTGIDSKFEIPDLSNISINTNNLTVEESIKKLSEYISRFI
ncbi:UNVERIFIED_CONTAM: hypothetical protein GTU68_010079 [Idotea baltica]|nr:hypothetical protein [Idotea baltica]